MTLAHRQMPPRRTVLIVDDERLVRRNAAMMVEDAGFVPLEAASADEAIELLDARGDIFLVLTDVQMPGSFDGSKLAAFVAGLWPPVRAIVTSGRVEEDDVPLADGVSFLAKPYAYSDLSERIAALAD